MDSDRQARGPRSRAGGGWWRTLRGPLRAPVQIGLVMLVIGVVANPLVLLLDATDDPLLEGSLRNACMLVAVLAALVLVARLDRRPLADYGLSFGGGWPLRLASGALAGALFVTIVVLVGAWLSGSRVALSPRTPLDAPLALALAGQLARYAAGGVFEEAISRGFLFAVLRRAWGRIAPGPRDALVVVATALVFGLLHLGNPEVTALATLNLVLAGALFGLLYLRTGDLHAPIGMHAAWNVTQNNVFGLPNGGKPSLAAILEVSGPSSPLTDGGPVGPEGGLVMTVALLLAIAACWRLPPRSGKLSRLASSQ